MVNRDNYTKVKAFLEYLREVAQLKPASVSRYGTLLKQLLVWADEHALAEADRIRPCWQGVRMGEIEQAQLRELRADLGFVAAKQLSGASETCSLMLRAPFLQEIQDSVPAGI